MTRTAYQLSIADYTGVGLGWNADAIGDKVYYSSLRSKTTLTGSYTAAGTSFAGTFAQVQAGVNRDITFVKQTDFNHDPLDDTGPSGMVLDPEKINSYQVEYQHGCGDIRYSILDPQTGDLIKIHEFQFSNFLDRVDSTNPIFSVKSLCSNNGGATAATLKCVHMSAYLEGINPILDPLHTKYHNFGEIQSANSDFANGPFLALKANRTFNGVSSFGQVRLLRLHASNDVSTSGLSGVMTIAVYKNPKINGDVDFQWFDETKSNVSYSSLTPGSGDGANSIDIADMEPIYVFSIGADGAAEQDMERLNLCLNAGSYYVFTLKTTKGHQAGNFSATWLEEQ